MDYANNLVCLSLMCSAITFGITVEAGVACDRMLLTLEPCLEYVERGGSSKPSPQCCNGVKTVFNSAKTTDRQKTCQCLKDAANEYPNMFDSRRASKLPRDCGVNFPYHITPNFDCKSIK